MKNEVKKVSKLIDEITTYFMYVFDCPRFDVHVERTDTAYLVDLTFYEVSIEDAVLDDLRSKLVVRRHPELEEYYWQLTGETQDSNELVLVSMMSDAIGLEYENGVARLRLRRDRPN